MWDIPAFVEMGRRGKEKGLNDLLDKMAANIALMYNVLNDDGDAANVLFAII